MKTLEIDDVEIINHADNFFVFATSQLQMENAAKALSSGIAGLPGGNFIGKTEQAVEIAKGFRMLGCWVSIEKTGELVADPTNTNVTKLRSRVSMLKQRIHAKLTAAELESDQGLRVEGLQDFLRLESLCQGWVNAFSFCVQLVKDVENDLAYDLSVICHTYAITEEELKPLKDASTKVNVNWYSGK